MFDYKGMSKSEIEKLVDDDFVKRSSSNVVFRYTSLYSSDYILKKYGYYPPFLPLYCTVDHGVYINSNIIYDYDSDRSAILHLGFTNSTEREKLFRHINKKYYRITAPMVIYKRIKKLKQLPNAHGTIFFLAHSLPDVEISNQIPNIIEKLNLLDNKFKPFCFCLHMHDIKKGVHNILLKNGIPVYTAGHTSDIRFAQRFYDILQHFKYSSSNSAIGSCTFYSIDFGIPFFFINEKPKCFNIKHRFFNIDENNDQEKKLENTFSYKNSNLIIDDKQKKLAEQYLNLKCSIPRFALCFLLYKSFFFI